MKYIRPMIKVQTIVSTGMICSSDPNTINETVITGSGNSTSKGLAKEYSFNVWESDDDEAVE